MVHSQKLLLSENAEPPSWPATNGGQEVPGCDLQSPAPGVSACQSAGLSKAVGRESCLPPGVHPRVAGRAEAVRPPSWEGHYLDVGVLDQAELLLDLVQFFLLPPDVGLQHPRPLLQLVFDSLEHAELC